MQVFWKTLALAGALSASIAGTPAAGHHSFAMFDNTKTLTLEGTVKEFQWTNPHTWVQLMVRDSATGKEVEWSIEGASPNGLARQGWTRKSIKAGDKAALMIHPMKEPGPGGTLISATINGQKIGGLLPETPAPAPAESSGQ